MGEEKGSENVERRKGRDGVCECVQVCVRKGGWGGGSYEMYLAGSQAQSMATRPNSIIHLSCNPAISHQTPISSNLSERHRASAQHTPLVLPHISGGVVLD